MSPTDWRDEARGIPVWAGAMWLWRQDAEEPWLERVRDDGTGPANSVPVAPDLSDPDTRAAYDRRLALALGAPAEAVDVGVRFYLDPGCGYQIDAGYNTDDILTMAWRLDLRDLGNDALTSTDDPLLARALAYPADKRATP